MLKPALCLVAILFAISCAVSASSPAASANIKGDWKATFSIAGHTAEGTLTFDTNGKALSGTIFTEHTGKGIVTDGTFEDNKINCTLKFEKHESIALTGEFKDDKISGTFATEGMTGTWTAERKK